MDEITGFCPTVIRALTETANILRKEGHEIVEFKAYWAADLVKVYSNMIF